MKTPVVFPLVGGCVFLLIGCGDRDRAPSEVAGDGGGAGAMVATAENKSAHFDAVNAHLDSGGVVYGYVDIAGDLDKLLEMGQEFYDQIAAESNGQMPANLDLKGIVSEIGLNQITAVGVSSAKDSSGKYLNKMYVHSPGGPAGVLKVLGGAPGPLKSHALAPADADLVIEQEFVLKVLKDVFLKVMAKIELPQGAPTPEQMLAQEIPNVGVTVGEILEKSNGRLMVIASIDETVKVPIPDAPIEIPGIDLLVALDGMGWLFEKLQGLIPPDGQGPFVKEEGDGYVKYSMQLPDEGPFTFYKPILHYDKNADRLMLASRQAYLDKCVSSNEPKLASQSSFKSAITGLPTKGNAFSYISADVSETIKSLATEAMANMPPGGPPAGVMEKLVGLVAGLLGEQAAVTVNESNGIYSVAKASQSMKTSLIFAAVYPAAITASVAAPMMTRARMREREVQMAQDGAVGAIEGAVVDATANVKQVAMGLTLYAVDNDGKFPDTLGDLVPDYVPNDTLLSTTTQTGENSPLVYFNGLVSGAEPLVIVATPESDASGNRVVGLTDGSVQSVSESDFLKLARKSIEAANQ